MTLFPLISLMINQPPWSMKVGRESDPDVAMIVDFTGSFLLGPTLSKKKADYTKPFMLGKHQIQAGNWKVFEDNCEWDEP